MQHACTQRTPACCGHVPPWGLCVRLSSAQHTADLLLSTPQLAALPQRLHAICRSMPCRTAWHTVMKVHLPRAQGSGGCGHGLHCYHCHPLCLHAMTSNGRLSMLHLGTVMLRTFGAL